MFKTINWGKLAGLIIGIVAIFILYGVLLAPLMKWGIIKGGEAAFGARTDVAKLSVNFFPGGLRIYGLQIANKNDPWKNIISIDAIKSGLNTEQLFYKRFVIDELSVEGLALGTSRNYSGALPIKIAKPKKDGKPPVDLKKLTSSLQFDPAQSAKKIAEVGPLESKEKSAVIQADSEKKIQEAETKVNSYKPEDELKKLDFTVLDGLDQIKTVPELQARLKKIDELAKQLQDIQKNYDTTKFLAENNLKSVQDNLTLLTELKNKDMAKIFAKLDFANYDLTEIGRSLLGPKINGYVDTGMSWLTLAQKFMPPKKPKVKKVKKLRGGMNIVFPGRRTMPSFLIKKIGLSGTTATGKPNEVKYSGQITDITSDAALWGKPAVIDIKGLFTKNRDSKVTIYGLFDHTKDNSTDSVSFEISGYDLAGMKLWDESTIPLAIKGGLGVISGKIKIIEGELDGKISFIGKKMQFERLGGAKDSLETIAAEAIQSAPFISAEIGLAGAVDSPEIRMTTNLDRIISDRLNKVVGEKLDAARKQIVAEYEKQYGAAAAELQAKIEQQQKQIQAAIAEKQAVIDAKTKELAAKQEELNNQIDEVKNGAIKDAEKKLKEAIPGLKF